MYRNLKDHKFPTRKCYLLYIIGVYLQNILTLQTLEVLRLGMGKSLYFYYNAAGVLLYKAS